MEVHALANRAGYADVRQRTVPATNCPGVVVQHRTSIGVSGDFFNKRDPEPFAIHWPLDHEKRRVIARAAARAAPRAGVDVA